MKNTDHIVCESGTSALVCLHCGERYQPNMPIAIYDYLALSESFTKRHRSCKKPTQTSSQEKESNE